MLPLVGSTITERPALDHSVALGGVDHRDADPVLDGAAGIEELAVRDHLARQVGAQRAAARRAACCPPRRSSPRPRARRRRRPVGPGHRNKLRGIRSGFGVSAPSFGVEREQVCALTQTRQGSAARSDLRPGRQGTLSEGRSTSTLARRWCQLLSQPRLASRPGPTTASDAPTRATFARALSTSRAGTGHWIVLTAHFSASAARRRSIAAFSEGLTTNQVV